MNRQETPEQLHRRKLKELNYKPEAIEELVEKYQSKGIYEFAEAYHNEISLLTKEPSLTHTEGEEWISVEEELPLVYETGNWDGKRSEPVLVRDKSGDVRICRLYSGRMYGFEFNDWYQEHYEVEIYHVVQWKKI